MGMTDAEYAFFMDAPDDFDCLLGTDYYVTNEHLLYADGSTGPSGEYFGYYVLAKEYYERYGIPLMHTETNLMEPRAQTRPELPSLTGARWWAAFAVFVLHALVFLPVYPFQKSMLFRAIHPPLVPMQLGAAGVTFFFVLSGFIIGGPKAVRPGVYRCESSCGGSCWVR